MLFRRPLPPLVYALTDWAAGATGWTVFYLVRKRLLMEPAALEDPYWTGLLLLPLLWVLWFSLGGAYESLYRKSRLQEATRTLTGTVIGCTALFFVLVLDDKGQDYADYYRSYGALVAIHFLSFLSLRLVVLTAAKRQLQSGAVSFPALLLAPADRAAALARELKGPLRAEGFLLRETLTLPAGNGLEEQVRSGGFALVVVGLERDRAGELEPLLHRLGDTAAEVRILARTLDILSGSVRPGNVLSPVLVDIRTSPLRDWQLRIKRILDVVVAGAAAMILLPLMLYSAVRVRLSSSGPVLFRQERVGYRGRPFTMYKFRSMVPDAEKEGPALSSERDPRITAWGRVMRKWRLDELPQLYNILRGDMSLVGPRPERRHFIELILPHAPYYRYLLKVKPGLTSWGMVQFGYARNLEELIARSRFDLLYVENISLLLDLKIMLYSIRIIFKGKGV